MKITTDQLKEGLVLSVNRPVAFAVTEGEQGDAIYIAYVAANAKMDELNIKLYNHFTDDRLQLGDNVINCIQVPMSVDGECYEFGDKDGDIKAVFPNNIQYLKVHAHQYDYMDLGYAVTNLVVDAILAIKAFNESHS